MKLSFHLFLFATLSSVTTSCPFSKTSTDIPDDNQHRHLRRRMASLREGQTKDKLASIVKIQARKSDEIKRSLQTSCVSHANYDDIRNNIAQMAVAIDDIGDRGHFFGGILRLAAHDFMDFDRTQQGAARLGSDGCLDFRHEANAGLPDIWCPDHGDCPLTALYDTSYASFMSRADFWVASANAVVELTSVNRSLSLPFRWGRLDRDECVESSERLPGASGCSDVENTFITRMGVSWRDAVALMGAHTLGRGDADFSGHAGTWVQNDAESTIFDKGFYEEAVDRAWRPRNNIFADNSDWTWGRRNRGVMMLHTDICLRFDIDGNNGNCCTSIDNGPVCQQLPRCTSSAGVRPEAFAAFEEFRAGGNNNNGPFYEAFSEAWQKATENGYDDASLRDLMDTCESPDEPTVSPVSSPTATEAPTVEAECKDIEGPVRGDRKLQRGVGGGRGGGGRGGGRGGRVEDCTWVRRTDRCRSFGDLCPVSCGLCP